ncbi:T9SS type A sorting domain-containing protein [Flavobacterium gelidilacus]|uniref:T9SS type A sorting domain-containing protein n=1 Tax=Flavobacterium gelidilacus TaxID=206041 RepID=UPI000A03AAFB|nr:T9SS type A sorting domain-containing protein [Flavobacterium gelidilacus]
MRKILYIFLLGYSYFAMAQSPSIINPTPLSVCDTNNDGLEPFDLTSKNAEILGTLNPATFSVSYHASNVGSFLNNNVISSPYINTTSGSQTIFVRVQNNSNPSSFSTTSLQLIVNTIAINNNIPAYAIYENPFDGFANFDLTSRNGLVSTNTNHQITYFSTQADAFNVTNQIANPTSFTGSNLQTIWFRVTDNVSNCFVVRSYVLKVFDSSVVVNIPDPKFKARLLAASPTELIASSGPNTWITLDANSDGEIQVSEALQVTYFRLSGFYIQDSEKITSLEGINAFTNLTRLECNNNFLQSLNIDSLVNLEYLACSFNNLSSLTLQNFLNLEELACGANPIINLNLQNLPNLKNLDCGGILQTTLDVTQLNSLINLDCQNSQLTSLNVQGLSNLGYLNCSNNLLSSINLQGTSIGGFYVTNNQLTSLNLQQIPNVVELVLNNNLLTDINVDGLNFLNRLECNNNLITTLNIESVTDYFQILRCSENSLLETIFIKNGIDEFIWAANCPNLQYICADESQIQSIQLGNAGLGNPNDYVLNSYCTFLPGGNYNTIKGKIIFDANSNGCDIQDLPQPNIRIDINDGTNQGAAFSSFIGNYGFYTQDGTFTVTPSIENPNWFTISPSIATIPFVDINNNEVIQDFCITPNGFHPDLEIVIAPIFPSRSGQDAVYQLVYKNKGNQTLSQVDGITLNYNQNLMDFISSTFTPSQNALGQLKWSYSNLIPFESRSFEVKFNINSTTDIVPVNSGDVLLFSTSIEPIVGDETVLDNTYVYNETVVDSFITNTITCVEGSNAPLTVIGDYLHYIINFENTGTAVANNIVLRMDINEAHFEINTLQILNTSHDCYTRISGNIVEFILENAMLDTGGHGNILLKIKTDDTLQSSDTITNQARIFYDYNFPIVTNLANTTFQVLSNSVVTIDNSVGINPNPSKDIVNIKANSTINSIEIYDMQGRIIQTKITNQNIEAVDISNYTNGIYFLMIKTETGQKVEKLIKE